MACNWKYDELKGALKDVPFPAMVVNLDCLDENIARISETVAAAGKKIRIASKSIRVPWLLEYIMRMGGQHFQGIMCFSVPEASFLASQGFDDLLVAYPTVCAHDLQQFYSLTHDGINITLMVDSALHIAEIEKTWQKNRNQDVRGKVCIDVDMSWRPGGQHLGVYRSPVRSVEDFKTIFEVIQRSKNVNFEGVMGYEAQVAGMGDKNPFTPLLNPAKKYIKKHSVKEISQKRKAIHDFLESKGIKPGIFNGGGSGSLKTSCSEAWLTEVTAGSGFLQSHLFDYYKANRNVPAFCFALQVSRIPQQGIVTCKSGGFVASGDATPDKWPVPFLPKSMKMVKNEGFGEVQTPVVVTKNLQVKSGDPLFFRPAKAGEIAERFNEYILIREHKIVDKVPTYRGLGQCFY